MLHFFFSKILGGVPILKAFIYSIVIIIIIIIITTDIYCYVSAQVLIDGGVVWTSSLLVNYTLWE